MNTTGLEYFNLNLYVNLNQTHLRVRNADRLHVHGYMGPQQNKHQRRIHCFNHSAVRTHEGKCLSAKKTSTSKLCLKCNVFVANKL